MFRIDYNVNKPNGLKIQIFCGYKPLIPEKFEGRIRVDEATGRVTLKNVTKSDGGLYAPELTNGNGRKEAQHAIRYVFHDKVWIRALSRNYTDGNISLTVACAGDPDTISWMDGGDLTAGYWLSDDNRTLTIPQDATGGVTVHVSNLVSAERRHITLINDSSGKHDAPIMYWNVSRVIWSDGGDQPGNQTLILLRNFTDLYVMTRSASNDPEVDQSSNHEIVVIIPVVVAVVILLVVLGGTLFFFLWRKKK